MAKKFPSSKKSDSSRKHRSPGKYGSLLAKSEHEKAQTYFQSKSDYENQLKQLQKGLLQLQRHLHVNRHKMVILFEGPDAAGKGGVIKRFSEYLDPRGVAVQSIGKPNVVEIEQQYMQRFFAKLPEPGVITIFDRSWYGRVLVERVEKICAPSDWKRGYAEINAIEEMLIRDKVLVLKYILDLSYDEQRIRFEERRKNPFKSWKLTDEDFRNRKKWPLYETAYRDVLKHTSTDFSPWTVVPADSKWFSRVAVLGDVLERAGKFYRG
ncbi:MAG: hypothetical protein J0L82_13150 [Deltaproteobacteria bacterium]|nr:hypothetical protein [Deltaproteobacteria bacterium]